MAVISNILYLDGTDLRIMSSSQMQEIQALAAWFYQQNPVETLTVVASGGDLSPTMTDRRYQAGTALTGADGYVASYAGPTATPDISAIDETYDRVSRTRVSSVSNVEPVENATNTAFPIYWDGATKTIKTMTKTDFFDTFIASTITNGLVGTSGLSKLAAGTYTVLTTGSSVAGNPGTSIVSTTPIFVDKRADAAAYTAAGIEETQDQPEVINNYYLHQIVQTSKPTYQMPLFMRSAGDGVQVYTTANFEAMVEDYILSATFGKAGYSITYEMDTQANITNQKGVNINDTYLSGSSADGYTTYLATIDDYRSQEFPNGTPAVREGWALGITTGSGYSVSADTATANEGDTVTFTVTTTNVTPGNIPYTITGISAGDLSSGSLTGNVTTTGSYGSASGTTQVTLANDTTTEGTEVMTFAAGGVSVSVTINDTSITFTEQVSLEGTTSTPEIASGFPLSDGSLVLGWRFSTDGTVEDYDVDRSPQYRASGHVDWVNTSTPATTYYIRFSVYDTLNGYSLAAGSSTLNTWHALSSNRFVGVQDNRAFGGYGFEQTTFKVEIADDASGSNILATGYYEVQYEGGA